jgi:CheY-like chemotaxis protein
MYAKRNRQLTLWLTNLTLRSGVNQSTETDLHPLSSIRILVVDDFKDWLRQVRLLLQPRPKSHVIAEASDGLEAVQKAEDLNPDLILLDIGLPKLNGIEAARQIRQRSPAPRLSS